MGETTHLPYTLTQSRLLTLKETCGFLHKSRVTIWRLINRKKDPLPAVRVGRSPMVPFDQLQWWLEKHAIN